MIRLLRAADHRSMPWKNGGGTTTEIAVAPDGAGLDDFDWRVSMARVGTDGPFSSFPDVDRTLTVLSGEGITLDVEGRMPLELFSTSDPATFPADVATSCRLLGGPVTDLNVMVRRGRFTADVHRVDLEEESDFTSAANVVLMFCSDGAAEICAGRQRFKIARHGCLRVDGTAGPISVTPQPRTELVVAELRAV